MCAVEVNIQMRVNENQDGCESCYKHLCFWFRFKTQITSIISTFTNKIDTALMKSVANRRNYHRKNVSLSTWSCQKRLKQTLRQTDDLNLFNQQLRQFEKFTSSSCQKLKKTILAVNIALNIYFRNCKLFLPYCASICWRRCGRMLSLSFMFR